MRISDSILKALSVCSVVSFIDLASWVLINGVEKISQQNKKKILERERPCGF